ncbi:YkvA family protein [Phosphitispora sp. TUW77]|uniref:YkvA family protein n=1 Tax=Phosphitispora sp. TUW77 TaxID=3152361 RepID=UPI003AB2E151
MAIIIPFPNNQNAHEIQDGEESEILSEIHKQVLRNKLEEKARYISEQDIKIIKNQINIKLKNIHSRKTFIKKMLERIKLLYEMLFDQEIKLTKTVRKTVAAGLFYFISQKDFLADDIPGLGYLDDAYIIRLVWEKTGSEIQNYLAIKGKDERLYI